VIKVCQWFSQGNLVSSTNKTNHHDVTEILLKVTLNTITLYVLISTEGYDWSYYLLGMIDTEEYDWSYYLPGMIDTEGYDWSYYLPGMIDTEGYD
jgi:hypothetical protein